MIVAMSSKFEMEKFNGNNFSLWKLKMKAILRKDKCLTAIGKRPTEVMNDSKWDEMEEKSIADLYGISRWIFVKHKGEEKCKGDLGSSCSISSMMLQLVFWRKKIGATTGRTCKPFLGGGLGGDEREGNLASTSEDGNALCYEVAIANEGRKRFTDVDPFGTPSCNDHELQIIDIGSIMVKMYDGEKVDANLYQLKEEIIEEAEAYVTSHSLSHKVTVMWHRKLRHMSEQGMKILIERKLLPGLTKRSLPFCEDCVINKQHRLKFKTSN
nr:hypothetical protein [Tanacetum cinerariifolium]